MAGTTAPPPEGARFDVPFEGASVGPKLKGKVTGVDYLRVRADGRFELHIHAEITTDEGPVVVVGHSAGGATISLVPSRARVDRLVYVTAVVPEPGRSISDVVGAGVRETMLSVSRDDGNGCRSFDLEMLASLAPPEEREATLAMLRATQRPQGWAAVEQPWPGRSLPDVPRSYVLCTEDTIIPPAKQREMAARLGVDPIEIVSDHSVFALQPRELAGVLAAQGRST